MTIPAELQKSTPRPVSLTWIGKASILGFCLVIALAIGEIMWAGRRNEAPTIMIVGVGFILATWISASRVLRERRLLLYGRAAIARTTGQSSRVIFAERGMKRYRVECEFMHRNGATSKTKVEVRRNRLAPNTEIVILYDPDEPEKAILYPSRLLQIDRQ